ncbi:hypothetical protein [Mycobacterium sp. E3198]|uniref:hypothetical protein n=1 Tax=Mycobacterium sp. E3198 TaxID=1834143 RepID=UPI0007FFF381|nr:hypothetical protein [Mycobacterium sp. E3198]OBG32525.1 hypothetical protein A5673_02975 [Mycobacterium sp. E3198]
MRFRAGGATPRWRSAIAVVAALGAFAALVAGSSLRPQFAAAALPEPATWSSVVPVVGAQAGHGQPRASRPWAPTGKKPFHSTWMTKDRPPTPGRVSPPSVGSPLPVSFTALGFQPRGARPRAPAAVRADPDILTRFCIARR